MSGRAYRIPAAIVILALLVAAAVIDRRTHPASDFVETIDLSRMMASAAPSSALSSTWFCAAGTARGSEAAPDAKPVDVDKVIVAEHSISMSNVGDRAQRASVTVFPSEGDRAVRNFDLPARARVDVVLSDLVKAPYASALVEVGGGLVAVEHTVRGPFGKSVAPCATNTSSTWHFAGGATRLDSRQVFVVFNPFPDQAVLEFSFETDGGTRDSPKYQGLVIPPQSAFPVDITDVITVREQISTTVIARSGRVVIDMLVRNDGHMDQPKSLSLVPGVPVAADSWLFASGPAVDPGLEQSFVVYNPGDEDAAVDLLVQVDASGPAGPVQPYSVNVRARRYEIISLNQDGRMPAGSGYWAAIRSRATPVVAIRIVRAKPPAPDVGTTITVGSPLVARRWVVAIAGLSGQKRSEVSIANPSATDAVNFSVNMIRDGKSIPLARFENVSLGAGARAVVDLEALSAGSSVIGLSLTVDASAAIVVERRIVTTEPTGLISSIAIPVSDTLELTRHDISDQTATTIEIGPNDIQRFGTVPPGSGLPGSVPPGTVAGATAPPGSEPVRPLGTDVPGTVVGGTE